MPIPPRPIPSHAHAQAQNNRRPGRSVPRKSVATSQVNINNLDWRAEVALISELGPKSLPLTGGKLGSSPSGMSGLRVVDKVLKKKDVGESSAALREVQLEGLIAEGRGKREKRATTATTLGFDFIVNPSVLALPDTAAQTAALSPKQNPSLLSISKQARPTASLISERQGNASPALSGTPSTPALLAQSSGSDGELDEDDDWEHVPSLANEDPETGVEVCDDEDVIVLGELELEDGVGKLSLSLKESKGARKASYAAALGARSGPAL